MIADRTLDHTSVEGMDTVHLKKGPTFKIKGITFEVVALSPNANNRGEGQYWLRLLVKPEGLNDLTESDLAGWGIELEELEKAVSLVSTQQAVIECNVSGWLPQLRGKEYSWTQQTELDGQGGILITIKAGHVPGTEAIKGGFRPVK